MMVPMLASLLTKVYSKTENYGDCFSKCHRIRNASELSPSIFSCLALTGKSQSVQPLMVNLPGFPISILNNDYKLALSRNISSSFRALRRRWASNTPWSGHTVEPIDSTRWKGYYHHADNG